MPLLKKNNWVDVDEIKPQDVEILGDRIAAKVLRDPKFVGSVVKFVIPDEYRKEHNIARVLNVGRDYEGPVKPGNYVIYASWTGKAWPHCPEEDVILMEPDNVVAIIEMDG